MKLCWVRIRGVSPGVKWERRPMGRGTFSCDPAPPAESERLVSILHVSEVMLQLFKEDHVKPATTINSMKRSEGNREPSAWHLIVLLHTSARAHKSAVRRRAAYIHVQTQTRMVVSGGNEHDEAVNVMCANYEQKKKERKKKKKVWWSIVEVKACFLNWNMRNND